MQVEYNGGSSKRFEAENEAALAKMLEREMKNPAFKTAQVLKGGEGFELPSGVANNRANRRKYGYTNNETKRRSYR